MASDLLAMASDLLAMASDLLYRWPPTSDGLRPTTAMASNLLASHGLQPTSGGLQPTCDGLAP